MMSVLLDLVGLDDVVLVVDPHGLEVVEVVVLDHLLALVGPSMNITLLHASAVNASFARIVTERDARAGWPVCGSRMWW